MFFLTQYTSLEEVNDGSVYKLLIINVIEMGVSLTCLLKQGLTTVVFISC